MDSPFVSSEICLVYGACCCDLEGLSLGTKDEGPDTEFIRKYPKLVEFVGPVAFLKGLLPGAPRKCLFCKGTIGVHASCSIYKIRPEVCRVYPERHNLKFCETKRAALGLPPIK